MFHKKKVILEIFLPFILLFIYCEYIHYYFVLSYCDWPLLIQENQDNSILNKNEYPLKILVISDIHLLGPRKTYWFEELFREWQMYRSFHTAVNSLKPEVIFILGDTFDEGLYLNNDDFDDKVNKFNNLFYVNDKIKLYTLVGNHDIGFHYEINKWKTDKFIKAFKTPNVQLFTIKGNHFVSINSMAMEGDDCSLCKSARNKLDEIEKILKCSKGEFNNGNCIDLEQNQTLTYSKPILIQHFPLYRPSDMECDDFDAAPFPTKEEKFKEAWDCLSKNSTNLLLKQIEPRLTLSGHTHHGCTKKLPIGNGTEITIPSINWRNKNNPTIGLGVLTPNNYSFIKCSIPQQSTWIMFYITGTCLIILWSIYRVKRIQKRLHSEYTLVHISSS